PSPFRRRAKCVLSRRLTPPALTRTIWYWSSRGDTCCPHGAGLARVSSGLVYRRPATRGGPLNQGREVAGRIEVTIQRVTALSAAESALGQAQLGFHRATARTRLGTGIPPAGDVHARTSPGSLVLNLTPQFTHTGVGNVARQLAVGHHAGDIEVFNHDRAVRPHQAGGELVQAVPPRVDGLDVELHDAGLALAPARRGHLPCALVRAGTPGGLPLQSAQLPQNDLKVSRIRGNLAG